MNKILIFRQIQILVLYTIPVLFISSCDQVRPYRVDSISTFPVLSSDELQHYVVKITHNNQNCVILWKGKSGIEIVLDQNNLLKTIDSKVIKYNQFGVINYLRNDCKIEAELDENISYSEKIRDYNEIKFLSKMSAL